VHRHGGDSAFTTKRTKDAKTLSHPITTLPRMAAICFTPRRKDAKGLSAPFGAKRLSTDVAGVCGAGR
jgi:hypothetical protein